ncbi:hypothetical protein PG997_010331 [Apiospora hydei]|uniref:Polyketide synthase n=1 Tax=Apiospora hydei TaxID=1337664 RepID=A0ABR1VWQ8_9PEZI
MGSPPSTERCSDGVPPERLRAKNFYHENGEMHGRTNVRQKSYLLDEDVRHFDTSFFHINPKEAADMDPQQRILLETVYEAFEAAGWPLSAVDGSQTSVYVGEMTDDYTNIQARDPDYLGSHAATGASRAILSNPAQGLQRGEATQAVVAGTNLLLDTFFYIMESSMHMLSPESRCRMWDKDADGYARGEGCAVLVIKTLERAIRDGDHIECVIRGTGVNSDGHTKGITMPSPLSQTSLIRQTYQAAGLDPLTDRCQYFECHGTGTQAGDVVECQAIRDAFFPEDQRTTAADDDILYCGSIKTVLGHLEGCAGLAGVIKASLAIQNKMIPPNMHFNQLNPKLEPFYQNLEVPTALLPWPETNGGPCRASVNSFGFGGTNAHAILESYDSSGSGTTSPLSSYVDAGGSSVCPSPARGVRSGPFVFSAKTQTSLVAWLKRFLTYLRENPTVDLDSLSHTLHARRTVHSHRVAIPMALHRKDLAQKLEDQINALGTSGADLELDQHHHPQRTSIRDCWAYSPAKYVFLPNCLFFVSIILGAQSARMGYALLQHCGLFKEFIVECERHLKSIPHPPTWSLVEELSANNTNSRVSEAEFSQPLCTAIQIGLVDLLHASGVMFSDVVGHSSGEIGAAYAAGLLTRKDAMGIAYYRGHVAHLARGKAGEAGRMMAAAMSFDTAAAICAEKRFAGRINVAASNSPLSVTLSGSEDAIDEMKSHLDDIDVQARMLKVDVAYHSHHMLACTERYSALLKQLDIQVQTPAPTQACRWFSSVRTGTNILDNAPGAGLEGRYWLDNMVQPVLFSQAVTLAVQANAATKVTAVIEVGPHPALKGPVNQTLKQATDYSAQYAGCLGRDKDAIETFSEVLTTMWHLAPRSLDLAGWRKALGGMLADAPLALKDLPSYAWDHTQIHWRESRVGRNYRLGEHLPHDILGRLWSDSQYEQTWRNILQLHEMPWVTGHVFQGQVLFPATGYLCLAVDAAKAFLKARPIKLVEVRNLEIPTALVIGEGDEVEIQFSIRSSVLPEKAEPGSVLEAEFVCYSFPDQQNASKTCHGKLLIHVGDSDPADLPPSFISSVELTPLNVDRFYHAASEIGFGYQGPFRALKSINRCWGHAKAVASWHREDLDVDCTLQPAVLDIALQTGLSTFISTAEGSMPSAFLPVGIRRVLINPNEAFSAAVDGSLETEMESYMTSPGMGKMMETDINVNFRAGARNHPCAVQMEGVRFQAIAEPQPSEDRNIIAKITWDVDPAYGLTDRHVVPQDQRRQSPPPMYSAEEYERVALFHLQSFSQKLKRDSPSGDLDSRHQALICYVDATVALIREDKHAIPLKEWLHDDADTIANLVRRYPNDAGMTELTKSNGVNGHSSTCCAQQTARLMLQISHKFPRTRILEISSGINSNTTATVLGAIGDAYEYYTCTGASEAIVNALKEKNNFASTKDFAFKVLDLESDVASQGFETAAYDVIIAPNGLRASPDFAETAVKLRHLLRPGGFLVATELTGDSLRPTASMMGSDTWWLGPGPGAATCKARPGLGLGEWDKLLVRSGFSGIDCALYDRPDTKLHGFSVFVTQAMDERLEILRDPLTSLDLIAPAPLVLIGGETSQVSQLVRSSFDHVDRSRLPPDACVISFQDLDRPFFSSPPAAHELKNFNEVVESARNILWVTARRLVDDPYANIMIGIGRALRIEVPHVNFHFLDFDEGEPWDIQAVVAKFLRLVYSSSHGVTDGILWADDPEVVIRNAQPMVARVVQDQVANQIYNAKRRKVTKLVGPAEPIEISQDAGFSQPTLICSRPVVPLQDQWPVHVELSVAIHSRRDGPRCFLCYGFLKDQDDAAVLTLSKVESSVVIVAKDIEFTSKATGGCDAEALVNIASLLIAASVVAKMPSSGTTLVCGASEGLADRITFVALAAGRKVTFIAITTTIMPKERDGWVYVHPKSTAYSVNQIISLDSIANVLDLSQKDADVISPWLPPGCTIQTFDVNALSQHSVQEALDANRKSQGDRTWKNLEPVLVNVDEISQARSSNPGHLSTVTNWKRDKPVAAIVSGLEPTALLSSNKTYFLVGMASELGQSLTYFMIRGGARHIVLSSRNPKEDQQWIHALRRAGVNIRLVKMDVTIRSQVRDTVAELRRTMPAIGGVTNAALVLDPGVFANLSAESIARQLRPKVTGTANLDDEFRTDALDFFMTFGSLLTVCGNAGQPIYHAGNAYMASLVQNRRRRGLAASVLNFGMLVDVGYVARSDRAADSHVEEWLRSETRTPLSEADFHHVILQGIVEGKPGSGSGEVIMGLETFFDQGQSSRPAWADSALCSHMQWKQKLEAATTAEQATQPITELLSKKIEAMIHVSLHSIHLDEPMLHLGIDSINAIGIRKWFRETLGVDVSMLKILGRDSVASILKTVAEQYVAKKPAQSGVSKPKATTAAAPKPAKAAASAAHTASPKMPGRSTDPVRPNGHRETNDVTDRTVRSGQSTEQASQQVSNQSFEQASEQLSYAQAGFYYLSTISESPTSFNITVKFSISGHLNAEKFCRAFQKSMLHHDAFRSAFVVDPESSDVRQCVTTSSNFQITQVQSSKDTAEEDSSKAFSQTQTHEYALAKGDALQATLVCHDAQWHTLVVGFHNIAIDAISVNYLLVDVDRAYQFRPLTPNPTSYLDFTRQQTEDVRAGRMDQSIAFWKGLLDPLPEALPLLPMAKVKTREIPCAYAHHRVEKEVSSDLVQRVKQICQANGATLVHFYLAAMQVVLGRLLSVDDMCIGIMHTGRNPDSEFAQTVGHLANILPVRFRGFMQKSLPDILANTSRTLLDCLDNANVPFAVISDRVRGGAGDSGQPLIRVAYNYRAGEIDSMPMGKCTVTRGEVDFTTLYDLTIDVLQSESNGTVLTVRCSDDFYNLSTAEFITDTFVNLLESMVGAPSALVKDLGLFNKAQLHQGTIVARGPDTQHEWPQDLSARFEQVAAEFPDSAAVKDSHETVTYRQLRQRVGTYAGILLEAKVKPGARVAVLCEPSVDLYATMLAVFHIGAVFVPLDVSVPPQRRKAMMDACKPDVLAFHAPTATRASEEQVDVRLLLNMTSLAQEWSHDPERTVMDPRADSYIVFTSGSTGVPKGIRLHQQGMMNYAAYTSQAYGFGQVNVLQQTSIGFDLAFGQIYNAFTNGGTLIAASVEARGDPDALSRLIHDEKVEYTLATPSEYSLLLNYASDVLKRCDAWRCAHTAGEVLPTG